MFIKSAKLFEVFVRSVVLIGMMAIFLVSCVARPERLESASLSNFAEDKLQRVTANQEPVIRPITLYEAMARAIKYNLDFHVELYNELLESRQLTTANLEMIPQLVANSAYNGRSNDAGGSTAILKSDKNRFNSDTVLTWNILDFGLSYVRAKQAANKVLIAEEQRRKIINRVIEDVRTAYWRAASADRLIVGLRRLVVRVRRAIKDSEGLHKDGVSSPLTALTYQRELVEIQQRIQALQSNLTVAKTQLSALMNIAPGQKFQLAPGNIRIGLTSLKMTANEMIFTAMENRPEIRDVQYSMRINQNEAKAALLQLLPSANLFFSGNLDSDSFLLNSNWVGWGAKATWNLMQVFKYPARKRLIQAKDELLDKRALAITMAIMTQVHVSRVRYANNRKLYFSAAKHLKIQRGILHQIRASAAADQASEQTLIREEMNTLASRVKRDIAYADLQNSYANIYSAMGLDPYTIESISSDNLSSISASLKEMWIERGVRSGALRRARTLKKNHRAGVSSHGATLSRKKTTSTVKVSSVGLNKPALDKSRFANKPNYDRTNERQKLTAKISLRPVGEKQASRTVLSINKVGAIVKKHQIEGDRSQKQSIKKPVRMKKPIRMQPVSIKRAGEVKYSSKPLALLRNNIGN